MSLLIEVLLMITRTIDENTEENVSSSDGRANAIKSLIIQTSVETFLQLYTYATNPALRSVGWYDLITIFLENVCFRSFAWKKIKLLCAQSHLESYPGHPTCCDNSSTRIRAIRIKQEE